MASGWCSPIRISSSLLLHRRPLAFHCSHYDLGCLATWPLLWLRSGAAFVIGDMTGTKVGLFLLNSNFRRGVGDWLEMYEGASLGPSILPIWAGDMLAHRPAVPASSVCEAMWAFETGFVGLSHRGGVVGTSHGCGVLDTNKRGVRVGTTHHGLL